MKRFIFAGIAATLALTVTAALPSSEADAGYVVRTGADFNRPLVAVGFPGVKVDSHSDSSVELKAHLVELINNTPSGAMIRISLYGWDDWVNRSDASNPTPAVVAAVRRGVSVRILLDRDAKLSADFATISAAMAASPNKRSFIRRCGDAGRRGCLGSAVNHSKYFLFSTVGSSKYVVVQGTGHITQYWGGTQWDAMATVAGRKALYNGYVKYFEDETANRANPNYYRTVTDGKYKAYFFPKSGNAKYNTADDPIYGVLSKVKCGGNTTRPSAAGHKTIVRIVTWQFTRTPLATKLRSLAKSGCQIRVVTNVVDASSGGMNAGVTNALKGVKGIQVREGNVGGSFYIHAKYLLVEGNYNGTPNSATVWVGSPNLTYPALKKNDENMLKVSDSSWHDQFRRNFDNIWTVSRKAW